MQYKHQALTKLIIDAFYGVYNGLGYGFLERVYENAMVIELQEMGLKVLQQAPIQVISIISVHQCSPVSNL